ncbi:MAG: transposase [Candidatus Gastranaerophilales bacterium]|nr:transposase [Candidatus Gastranaerophilales bacterium]
MNNGILNVQDCWLDVDIVAELKGITERAVRLAIRKKKYITKACNTRGGKSYKILLSSLEPKIQQKYLDEYYKDLVLSESQQELIKIEPKQEKIIPEHIRKIALARLDLLKLWDRFRRERGAVGAANKDFLQLYNSGEFHANIFQTIGKVSIGTLYRWKQSLGTLTCDDWTRLVPEYNYSSDTEYRTSLTDEEIRIFMKLLLNQNRFSVGKAISLTKHILQTRGIDITAKEVTFRRYAEWFKKYNYDKWILSREGQKALRDKVEPYIVRDASILDVGQILISDGHKLNFQVINPFNGKPCRATLVGFLDWKSAGLVGYEIMLEECTQSIVSALRNSILRLGKIPDIVYQDNGKAFRAKFFTGDKNFEELGFNGIYGKLGIKPVYATPYNARAKVIERFFLEFQESFEKLLPSYIGSSIENKPAYLKRNEELHKEIHNGYVPTIQEAIQLIETWLEYKHSQPCPNVPNKTIAEVLAEVKKQEIDEQELDDLMLAMEIKTIGRNGIRFLKSDYFDDSLYGIRDKAIIKYSLFDISYIKVYSMKGEYLCKAYRVMPTHPMAQHLGDIKDIEDYKQKIVKQRQLRNKTLKAVKQYFKAEDINMIEKHLIDDLHQTPVIQETPKLIPKIIPNQVLARPIFKSKFERFEWHLKQGCINQADRRWVEVYKKSDEYTMIYGEA